MPIGAKTTRIYHSIVFILVLFRWLSKFLFDLKININAPDSIETLIAVRAEHTERTQISIPNLHHFQGFHTCIIFMLIESNR